MDPVRVNKRKNQRLETLHREQLQLANGGVKLPVTSGAHGAGFLADQGLDQDSIIAGQGALAGRFTVRTKSGSYLPVVTGTPAEHCPCVEPLLGETNETSALKRADVLPARRY